MREEKEREREKTKRNMERKAKRRVGREDEEKNEGRLQQTGRRQGGAVPAGARGARGAAAARDGRLTDHSKVVGEG